MAVLYYLPQFKTTTLSVGGGIDASQTTGIVLQSVTGITITKPGVVCISWSDPLDTGVAEWISYTSIDGSNELQGVTRGAEGSTGRTHLNGATVAFPVSKAHVNNINDKLTGIDTDGVQLVEINDTNGNEQVKFTTTASAVNELTITNAATGNSPTISATGGDTDIDIVQTSKGAGQHKCSMRIQKDTTSSTVSGVSTQVGWGFITGNGSSTRIGEAVTLPTAFANEILGISITFIGMKQNSDPTAITDFDTTTDDDVEYRVYGLSTTGFTAEAESDAALASINRYGYSWVAYGR